MTEDARAVPEAEDLTPDGGGSVPQRMALRSAEFRRVREDGWRRLEGMVNRVEGQGIGALSSGEATEIALLYRAAASSLSVARNIVLDRGTLTYLENLTLRAYLVVYGPRHGVAEGLAEFFKRGFPRAVRAMRPHLAIALAAMMIGVASGYAVVSVNVEYFSVIAPRELAGGRGPGSTAEELMSEELFAPWPGFVDAFVVFANSLFRHNTIVGILCFGLGFAAGVPTILLLLYNGAVIGAFVALHERHGLAIDFIGWLSIHGVTEILAILLCGAAGLVIAEHILFPGAMTRIESLTVSGRTSAGVVAGTTALFFAAGILEGGFRQLIGSTPGRGAFAAATAALWAFYFLRAGRGGGADNGDAG
ncbi:MAG: stage II sporulation protein M [Synergistaceae bacterium]|jgi:uncharacterized membrane protein SpoIIM required for sporulation|nr:stage II sporulation protein M [Synergistaceae bacterium]